MKKEVIILVDAGIGNAIQALYSFEYLIRQNVDVGIYLGKVNQSFQDYLKACYGSLILDSIDKISCNHLIQSFTFQEKFLPKHNHYYFLSNDFHAAKFYSETEQMLNIVEGLFPHGRRLEILEKLISKEPKALSELKIADKYVIYPGGSSINSARRWSKFEKLVKQLGGDRQALIIGGNDDLEFKHSYIYPKIISALPQAILNRKGIWNLFKKLGLLKPWAHNSFKQFENTYFNQFNWEELVYIFKECKKFIGNDGGLTHLAAASGARGLVVFGPTSVEKNKPLNAKIRPIVSNMKCSPCQYGVGGIQMTIGFINCPFQLACLNNIKTDIVLSSLSD